MTKKNGCGPPTLPRRTFLRCWEAAYLLETTERDVRNRIRRGELAGVRTGKLLQVEVGPLELDPGLSALGRVALQAMVDRRLIVRRPGTRSDAPASLEAAIPQLIRGLKR